MKPILLALFLLALSHVLLAQTTEQTKALNNYFWGSPNESFKNSEVPEKWKNESAVILAKCVDFKVSTEGLAEKLFEKTYFHERIKLMDQNAVEKFSQFSFSDNWKVPAGLFSSEKQNYSMGIKIEKSNGEVVLVNMEEAVKKVVESGNTKIGRNKIAVPNLQTGDIIDFFYFQEHSAPTSHFETCNAHYSEFCNEYPIVEQTINIEISGNTYLNAKSINGAPTLTGGLVKDGVYAYTLTDRDREKIKDEEFVNFSQQYPILKFQIYYLKLDPYSTTGLKSLYGPAIKNKDHLQIESLKTFAQELKSQLQPSGGAYIASVIKPTAKYLSDRIKAQTLTNEDIIREGYYYLREYWYNKALLAYPSPFYFKNQPLNELWMTILLSNALSKLKIEHEIVFVPNKWSTRHEDLLFLHELMPGIKSKGSNATIILSSDIYSFPNELPTGAYGTKGFAFPVFHKTVNPIAHFNLPTDTATNNTTYVKTEVCMANTESDSLYFKSHFMVRGAEKRRWDSTLLDIDIFEKEFPISKYGKNIKANEAFGYQPEIPQKEIAAQNKRIKNAEANRLESIKKVLEEYYNISDIIVSSIKVEQYGRFEDKPEMLFEVTFKAANLLLKAGENTIIPVGRLIKYYDEFSAAEREADIHVPYPKIVSHDISIMKNGTNKMDGLEQLTTHFESNGLLFDTSYSETDSLLNVKTTATWHPQSIKKDNWEAVVDYSKALAEFNNKKLIIKQP